MILSDAHFRKFSSAYIHCEIATYSYLGSLKYHSDSHAATLAYSMRLLAWAFKNHEIRNFLLLSRRLNLFSHSEYNLLDPFLLFGNHSQINYII